MIASDIKRDFPILNGNFIYLDSAATSQKPKSVIDSIVNYYEKYNANVHRSVYKLAEDATDIYEGSREKVAKFIKARKEEIIFTRNTTESINMLSFLLLGKLNKGDKILLTMMEHHSNLLPWLKLRDYGINIEFINIDKEGYLDMEDLKAKLDRNVKIVSMTHVSNVLGTINNIDEIGKMVKEYESLFIIDGAQSIPHIPFSVNENIDFLAFSGHKMLGPMGIGVLYGKYELLRDLGPFMQGGEMVRSVSLSRIEYEDPPIRFEAGTPNVEGAVGLASAIDYLNSKGMENIMAHERELTKLALELAQDNRNIEFYGPTEPGRRSGLISFNMRSKNYEKIIRGLKNRGVITGKFVHPHDLSEMLGRKSVYSRSGYHCAEPLFQYIGVNGGVRFSWYLYNTHDDLVEAFRSLGDLNV